MWEKISFIISIFSLVALIFIIARKFPVLAVLNVENIPGEKEASFKKEIIKKRVDRDLNRLSGVFGNFLIKFKDRISNFLFFSEKNLKKIKNVYQKKKISWADREKLIKEFFVSAKEAMESEDEALAEEKLLEIISLDPLNLKAFFELAHTYTELRKWAEAEQTFRHALKLAKKRKGEDIFSGDLSTAEIHFSLAEMFLLADNISSAWNEAAEALDLEPKNPRYLDLILDLSIMKKDKNSAVNFLERLSVINPENTKLSDWQTKIEALNLAENEEV